MSKKCEFEKPPLLLLLLLLLRDVQRPTRKRKVARVARVARCSFKIHVLRKKDSSEWPDQTARHVSTLRLTRVFVLGLMTDAGQRYLRTAARAVEHLSE